MCAHEPEAKYLYRDKVFKKKSCLILSFRQKMERDTAVTQQQLYRESEIFSGQKEQVEEKKRQLEMLEEEVRVLVMVRDSVAREEQEARKQLEEDERRAEQLEHRLMELHTDLAERQTQLQVT